jgi:hypothetical protein
MSTPPSRDEIARIIGRWHHGGSALACDANAADEIFNRLWLAQEIREERTRYEDEGLVLPLRGQLQELSKRLFAATADLERTKKENRDKIERLRRALLQWKRREIDGAACFCEIEPIPVPTPKVREHTQYCAEARHVLDKRDGGLL